MLIANRRYDAVSSTWVITMKFNAVLVLGAVACCTAFAAASAHADQRDDESRACRGDAFKLCSSEIPDEDKIATCMKQHVNELSAQCRVYFVSKKMSK
ncbi:Cysteine rich repeat protein (plasmid) [Pararobbsia alpina]